MVFYVKPVVENYLKKQTRIEQKKQQARITRQNRVVNFKKELDSKNGFQDFHFGMTTAQITEIKKPSRELSDKENKSKTFIYERDMMLFKYPLESVQLEFFDDKLHRIDISFSSNPNKIYNTFKSKYGIPFKKSTWTRGGKPLIGKMWDGNTVSCVILLKTPIQRKV